MMRVMPPTAERAIAPTSGQRRALTDLIERTLEFSWHAGDVTPVSDPHDTGWRTLPYLVTASGTARGALHLQDQVLIGEGGGGICVVPQLLHRCQLLAPSGVSTWSCTSYTILGGIDLFALVTLEPIVAARQAELMNRINADLAAFHRSQCGAGLGLVQLATRKRLGFALLEVVLGNARWLPEQELLVGHCQQLAPVFAHIRDHLGEALAIPGLARQAGLSPARFHAVFRQATGRTPHAWVQACAWPAPRSCCWAPTCRSRRSPAGWAARIPSSSAGCSASTAMRAPAPTACGMLAASPEMIQDVRCPIGPDQELGGRTTEVFSCLHIFLVQRQVRGRLG